MQKIYFLSGTMCNQDLWQFVFPEIEKYTPKYIDITSASSFEEINAIINSKITPPAILIGFSLGGFSALNFASQYPEKIKKLIIIAANAKGLSEEELRLRRSTIQFLETHTYKGISNTRIKQFLHPNNHQNKEVINIIKKMDADLGIETLIKQLKATSKRVDITAQLKTIDTPILFIGSKEDALVSHQDVLDLKTALKTSIAVILKNCGHMIPLEKPKELAEIINNYL
ncbi:MAG: alpha/beta hydrolase [Flavobacteriaceae bacterium]|nr:alpha/beta hydrolase [Flavobacteriaceae bacterium]